MEGRITQSAFADVVGCGASHLSLILSGDRRPSYDLAKRMSAATDGAVSIEMIFEETNRLGTERAA